MNKKILRVLFVVSLLFISSLNSFASEKSISLDEGDNIVIIYTINSISDLYGYSYDFIFDKDIFEITSVENGDIFDENSISPLTSYDNAVGELEYWSTRQIVEEGYDVSDENVLLKIYVTILDDTTLTLKTTNQQSTELTLENYNSRLLFSDSNSSRIQAVDYDINIQKVMESTSSISGYVKWKTSNNDGITVNVYDENDTTYLEENILYTAATDANGNFSIAVIEGTYRVEFSYPRCLKTRYIDVDLGNGESLSIGSSASKVQLLVGDVNNDGNVNIADYNTIRNSSNFNKTILTALISICDVNGDGNINMQDANIVRNSTNFNKTNVQIQYN